MLFLYFICQSEMTLSDSTDFSVASDIQVPDSLILDLAAIYMGGKTSTDFLEAGAGPQVVSVLGFVLLFLYLLSTVRFVVYLGVRAISV